MKLTAPRSSRRPMRSRSRTKKYGKRVRFTSWMLEVKRLTCAAFSIAGHTCSGPIEADHAGPRGLGQKAHDATVIPLCTQGHRERTDFSGPFRSWNQSKMHDWLVGRVLQTQRYLTARGYTVPEMTKDEFAAFALWCNLRIADDIPQRDIKPSNMQQLGEDIREVGDVDVRFPEGDRR